MYKNCNEEKMVRNEKARLRAAIFKYKNAFFRVIKIIHMIPSWIGKGVVIHGNLGPPIARHCAVRNKYKYHVVRQNIISLLQKSKLLTNIRRPNIWRFISRYHWRSTFLLSSPTTIKSSKVEIYYCNPEKRSEHFNHRKHLRPAIQFMIFQKNSLIISTKICDSCRKKNYKGIWCFKSVVIYQSGILIGNI